MKRASAHSVAYSAFSIALFFAVTLLYSGAGFNLHWLALNCLLLLVWLSVSIANIDLRRMHLAWGWLAIVIGAYLGWLLIAPFVSTYPYASSTTAMGLAVLPFIFFGWLILPLQEQKRRAWDLTWRLLLGVSIVLAAWGAVDFLVLHNRANASFLDPNAYAALMNLFLIPVAHTYLNAPPSNRPFENPDLALWIVALLAGAQYMSLSRGALLALLATLPLLLWFNRHRPAFYTRLPKLLAVLVSAYVVVQLAPVTLRHGTENFLLAPGDYVDNDPAFQARLSLLKSTWRMIEDANLLVGTGLGTFKTYYPAYREPGELSLGNFAHNDYLQALHDGGLVQLGFFFVLTVFAPLWLIRRSRSGLNPRSADARSVPGLMLGIVCISVHALVNFIHFLAPMIFITGLFLARGWETVRRRRELRLPLYLKHEVKPAFLKGVVVLVLATPVLVLLVDGIIFKLFATTDSIHMRMQPDARFAALNLAIAIRPDNPMPRIHLIRVLLDVAERTESPQERAMLLHRAEIETADLSRRAPALVIGQHFFVGRIRALKGTPAELLLARTDLERAVELVPTAIGMRLELVKIYRKLGQELEAYETVREAKKWITLEVDFSALAEFAAEAQSIAAAQGDTEEAKYWYWVSDRLAAHGYAA